MSENFRGDFLTHTVVVINLGGLHFGSHCTPYITSVIIDDHGHWLVAAAAVDRIFPER